MKIALRTLVLPVLFTTLTTACVFSAHMGSGKPVSSSAAPDTDLDKQIEIAHLKLDHARIDAGLVESEGKVEEARAAAELELAQRALAQFNEIDAPVRLGLARLELQGEKDSSQEAAEELAQLEMMYTGHELGDKTSEIVLNRGKRKLERAKERFALKEQGIVSLETRALPAERKKLELEIESKSLALQRAGAHARTNQIDKRVDLLSAEMALAKLEKESGGSSANKAAP